MSDAVKQRTRTCIGCGAQSDKTSMYRIVRTVEGNVCLDMSGRVPGRGAYVCSKDCLETACARGKLQRSLKCSVGKQDAAQIAEDLEKALCGACAR